jgi:hypothetical protein
MPNSILQGGSFAHDNVLYHAQTPRYADSMKLDKDLVREILLAVETSEHNPCWWMTLDLPGHSLPEISYHVQLLDEAGFLQANGLNTSRGHEWRPKRLTYDGHEFLNTVRDDEIWRLTKEGATKAGVASVQVLFEIGKAFARQKLAEHGIPL